MVARIAAVNLTPAKLLFMLNSAASVVKTVLGFTNTQFKTTFMISRREDPGPDKFGEIIGSVHDKGTGLPIEGVLVKLEGEADNNPLNPDLDDITNSDGAYFFQDISIGPKTLRATKSGYNEATVDVFVLEQQTVTAPLIELSGDVGTVHGIVANRIFLWRSIFLSIRFVN